MPPSPHHPSSSIPLLQTRLKRRAADHFIPTVSTQGWTREDLEALLSSPSTEILRVFGGQELSPHTGLGEPVQPAEGTMHGIIWRKGYG